MKWPKEKRTKNNSQFYGLHRESVDDFCTPAVCQYIFLMQLLYPVCTIFTAFVNKNVYKVDIVNTDI